MASRDSIHSCAPPLHFQSRASLDLDFLFADALTSTRDRFSPFTPRRPPPPGHLRIPIRANLTPLALSFSLATRVQPHEARGVPLEPPPGALSAPRSSLARLVIPNLLSNAGHALCNHHPACTGRAFLNCRAAYSLRRALVART
ncbi:hypothetical protein AURDEDRAFT_118035 [Auricularia subglabra TFB-10046 SS5]|uniref:Uncharacterized protein n=1 Tax=Auricularia subglabra (strain TFB-10046 / SS5) TaxID=717982 RepID=J0L872_AURST|nr:hypothetical protein AURDEDRAFT_118035 [Auricularia subglabra TFB-10046 SS5]